jgi:hypothetical protein
MSVIEMNVAVVEMLPVVIVDVTSAARGRWLRRIAVEPLLDYVWALSSAST